MNAPAVSTADRHRANAIAPDFQEKSYWWAEMSPRSEAVASLPKTADVVIVGGGVTGLNAAIELSRAGKSVVVLDAGVAGYGASSRNTGFLGRFLKKSFAELAQAYGVAKATEYYAELYQALNVSMKEVIEREDIDCDFAVSGRVVLARSASQLEGVVSEFKLRHDNLGEAMTVLDKDALQREIRCSDIFCGGVLVPDMAMVHPGKYHRGLLAAATKLGAQVIDNARVTAIEPTGDRFRVETPLGALSAAHVIVATNGYAGKELAWFGKRLVPFQGFVIATEETSPERLLQLMPTNRSYTDADFDTMAIRITPDGKRIVTSGRTGRAMPIRAKAALLRRDLLTVFPQLEDLRVSYAWSGFCAAPLDTMPKIGRRSDGVWFATGFTFMGMPQGSYFGRKVAQQLLGQAEGRTSYSDLPFKSAPLYNGKPWFLPPLMAAMRFKDYFANR